MSDLQQTLERIDLFHTFSGGHKVTKPCLSVNIHNFVVSSSKNQFPYFSVKVNRFDCPVANFSQK